MFLSILFIASLNLSCDGQTADNFNLGIEQLNKDGKIAEGWFNWSGYDITMDHDSNTGKYSGKITSNSEDVQGRMVRVIPANYNGDTITLEGHIKTNRVKDGHAGLFLKLEGSRAGYPGFVMGFETMENQNLQGSKDWQKYSISLKLPEAAEYIFIGGILTGKGEAWFDDFRVLIDGKDISGLSTNGKVVYKADLDREFDMGSNVEIPELDDNRLEDLELLGKIWGFLKYYHPQIGMGNYNWDYELFRILPGYLTINTIRERDEYLREWIKSFAPYEICVKCGVTDPDAYLKPDLGWLNEGNLSIGLRDDLNEVYLNRHQGEHYYIGMAENVGNPEFRNEKLYEFMTFPDKGFRLLSVYKYWNIIQYFFPYKNLTDNKWSEVLKKHIPSFLNAKSELEYELAAIRLIGEVDDTHANLWGGKNRIEEKRGKYFSPFKARFIEDEFVVTEYLNPELQYMFELSIGDIIKRIDGRSIESIVDSVKFDYPASNEASRMRDISNDLLRSDKKEITLDYISNGKRASKNLKLYELHNLDHTDYFRNDGGKSHELLRGNIGYITLRSLRKEEIESVMELFRDTKGIIIDIRNYPNTFVPFSLGPYFVSSSTPFVKFTKGKLDNPGEFVFTDPLEIAPSTKMYNGKLIVLVNEFSQSQAEYTAMAFRAGKDVIIMGSTTAGADGNISSIQLPGGLSTSISGIGVYYPNGIGTQRVGIVPDIVVEPTINGIKRGADELMEMAVKIINE
ncbi:Peptidase family S41 [Maribacter dokdonensis]|nr:Peptidase family S41 [Maribacter dokdonensis]